LILNVRSDSGREVLHRMLDRADVLLVNVSPAKLSTMGLDPDVVRERWPRLIYCILSGFGIDGPDHGRPGYDLAAQARSGLMSVTGARGGSPQRVSTALSDVATGMCAALAVSAAAVRQAVDGTGEVIDVSLLDTDLALMAPRIASYLAGDPEPAPSGGTDSVLAVYQAFPTADRQIVVAIGNDAMWRRFAVAIGRRDLAQRTELADNQGRREHRPTLLPEIERRLVQRTAAQWMATLADAGVPCSLVQSLSEVVADEQVLSRQGILAVPGSAGALNGVRSPFRLRSLPVRNHRFPELGADTRSVLAQAGYGEDEIEELIGNGIVGVADSMARGGILD
jgi:crotonobetainyl-CoA:carnitine CoA-transferase CaiB-like acyl-CoA transferase